jgi:DHA2 family multidrug resistance protein
VTFSTLDRPLVPDGTAIFHLIRIMGSPIFPSVSIAMVIRMSRTSYSELVPNISPLNEALRLPGNHDVIDFDSAAALGRISAEIARQATMIGYVDGFVMFAVTSALAIPLIALVRVRPAT